jgi:NitT/TauT family transport system substrate-binding protein
MKRIAILALALMAAVPAPAAEKITFLSSWKAQAEHGGYYQALAKGYYAACGLDLSIRQGGPNIDGKQLLAAGAVDLMMSTAGETVFQMNAAGFEGRAVMAIFQKNPQVLLAHEESGFKSLEDMRGKPIMISAASRTGFWTFLRGKYGFTDAQIRPYTGQLAPFLVDPTAIQQALVTNEPNRIKQETGKSPKVFILADYGYPSYASIAVAAQTLIDGKPAAIQCFVDGSIKGWVEFFKDPAPAVALIKKDNPDNPDDVIAYAISTMKSAGVVETPETAKYGLGTMNEERWKAHYDLLVAEGQLTKELDYRKTFTLAFVNKRVGM